MGLVGLIDLLRRVDRLLDLEGKHGKAIASLEVEINALKMSIARLEAREDIVVAEAKAAAGAAAVQVAVASVADIARRIGVLEERSGKQPAASARQIPTAPPPDTAQ